MEEVLYFLFGQDFKTKTWTRPQQSWNRYKPNKAYAAEEFDFTEDDEAFAYEDQSDYAQAPDSDELVYYEQDELYDLDDFGDDAFETYDQAYDEEQHDAEMEEAYSTYLDARKRFANIHHQLLLRQPKANPRAKASQVVMAKVVVLLSDLCLLDQVAKLPHGLWQLATM